MLACIWKRVTACGAAVWKRLICCDNQNDASSQGNIRLLKHFLAMLEDGYTYAKNPSTAETKSENAAISARIDQLFAKAGEATSSDEEAVSRLWEWAYEIERLLVYLRPRSALAIEVDRRVDEAKRFGLQGADKYRTQLDAAAARLTAAKSALATASNATALATEADRQRLQAAEDNARAHAESAQSIVDCDRRSILAAALDDLQWQYQKNNLVRAALWDSASNLLMFGWFTASIVAFPFFCFVFERWTGQHWFSNLLAKFPNYGLYTAISFGLLGAFFSRLTSLNFTSAGLTLEDAENRFSFISLAIRGAVGALGAMVFYYIMRTGIIAAVAPDFDKFAFETPHLQTLLAAADVLIPSKDWSLLILWSFIAGFSERLVPDTLSKVEAQVSGKKA